MPRCSKRDWRQLRMHLTHCVADSCNHLSTTPPALLPVKVLLVMASRAESAPWWLIAPPSTPAVLFTKLRSREGQFGILLLWMLQCGERCTI